MRLICPNCDAEYEVDAAAIPEGGRDVQCSACGHAWFQLPPAALAEREEEAALYDAPAGVAGAPPAPAAAKAPPAVRAAPAAAGEEETAVPAGEAAARTIGGRSLDESLMAVLREEAERESAARRAEGGGLETQTEMPLAGSAAPPSDTRPGWKASEPGASIAPPDGPPAGEAPLSGPAPSRAPSPETTATGGAKPAASPDAGIDVELGPAAAAMRKIAELRGRELSPAHVGSGEDAAKQAAAQPVSSPAEKAADGLGDEGHAASPSVAAPRVGEAASTGGAASRRELLPEIDEINPTLRPAGEMRPEREENAVTSARDAAQKPAGGAFRSGFLTIMAVVIVGAVLYLAVPFIVAKVPALRPAAMVYVHAVDGLRIGLKALVQGLSNWVTSVTGGNA